MGLQNFQTGIGSCGGNWPPSRNCDNDQCQPCADFTIKRHDTRPAFKVQIEECDPSIDWSDPSLVVEANIWYKARLKAGIDNLVSTISLADNVGFDQMLVDDIIVIGGPRSPEMMLVTDFNEAAKTVTVTRGYHNTTAMAFKKGTKMKVFRNMNAPAVIENAYDDVLQEDGTTQRDQLMGSYLVYNLLPTDTCLPGCFCLEFKLMRMITDADEDETKEKPRRRRGRKGGMITYEDMLYDQGYRGPEPNYAENDAGAYGDTAQESGAVYDGGGIDGGVMGGTIFFHQGISGSSGLPSEVTTPSDVSLQYGCSNGLGVEWVRRFPSDKESFLIQVIDSPTAEF